MSGADNDTASRSAIRQRLNGPEQMPGILCDRYLTVVVSNGLARALSPAFVEGVNLARFTFLEAPPSSRTERCRPLGQQIVAMLRESVDLHRDDERFRSIVGELSSLSRAFASAWATPVIVEHSGEVELVSATAGVLTLTYTEQRVLDDDQDDRLVMWDPADPSSRAALNRLRVAVSADS